MEVAEATKQLTDAVLNSHEYKEYCLTKDQLHQHEELEKTVFEFRRKNYLIQNSKSVDLFQEADQLEEEFYRIRTNPLVERYLKAETALCRLIQNINFELIKELEF